MATKRGGNLQSTRSNGPIGNLRGGISASPTCRDMICGKFAVHTIKLTYQQSPRMYFYKPDMQGHNLVISRENLQKRNINNLQDGITSRRDRDEEG
ncbi:hypothetical protein QE152_g22998 [Popillia japonica]|uniref:Uncharacterized protein n=1 Tax=Popillia japonica TaxID=7064 RepID=A0AAW1KJW1_POPJA